MVTLGPPAQVDNSVVRGTAVALVVLAFVSSVWIFATSQPLDCAFIDGQSYCRMAEGLQGDQPFSRRILVPWLVSILPSAWSLTMRFQLLAVVGLVGVVAGTYALTHRLACRSGLQHIAVPAAAIAAAMTAMTPHSVHLARYVPTFVDIEAVGLALLWVLLLIARSGRTQWAGVALSFPMVLTREAWMLAAVVAALVLGVALRRWWHAAGIVCCSAAALVVGLLRPYADVESTSLDNALTFLKSAMTSPVWMSWSFIFAVGLVPLLIAGLVMFKDRPDWTLVLVGGVGGSHLALAIVGGYDVTRIASAGAPFLIAAGVVVALRLYPPAVLAATCLASLLLWQPFRVLEQAQQYEPFYYPSSRSRPELLAAMAFTVVLTVFAVRSHRRRPAEQPVPD